MEMKTITIQTNETKKGKLDQRPFTCQMLEFEESIIYVLDDTKNSLTRKRFTLTPGCRIIDGGVTYIIQNIMYSERPMRPYLVINRKASFKSVT